MKDIAKTHFKIHTQVYNKVYNYFPDFDELFDEENFYLFAAGIVIMSILGCFLLSKRIKLREIDY